MGISQPCEIGVTVLLDFLENGQRYFGRPVFIIREATAEEWVQYRVEEGYEETSVRQGLRQWQQKIPGLLFYQVSVD